MTNWKMNNRTGSLASVASEYLFICLPFVILLIVRLHQERGTELLTTSDWGIASGIIYGQLIVRLATALATTTKPKKISAITLNFTILVCLGLSINLVTYSLMLTSPSIRLGYFQLILFALASASHFIYGTAINRISEK